MTKSRILLILSFGLVLFSCSSPVSDNAHTNDPVKPNENVCDTRFFRKDDLVQVAQQAYRIGQNCNLSEDEVIAILSK